VGTLRASGIGLRPLLGRGLTLGAAVFDSLELDIRYDHLVAQKRDSVPGLLPHQRLQRVRDPVRIGHLVIRNSRFRYYDRAVDGSRFGVLRFDSLNLRIRNISNSPLAMSAQRPSVVDVRAAFMGVGPLTMRFAWDLSSEPLNLSYEGSLGRMDVRALNQLLVDYQGVRIQSGRVDSIWFNVDVRDDKAKGKLQARYHDLEIELVDKQSRDQGLGDMIRSIFANWKLRGSNPSDDDEPVHTASLALSRQPDNSLFRFLWNALRQGLYATIGYGG
jgi:hypothetical protein